MSAERAATGQRAAQTAGRLRELPPGSPDQRQPWDRHDHPARCGRSRRGPGDPWSLGAGELSQHTGQPLGRHSLADHRTVGSRPRREVHAVAATAEPGPKPRTVRRVRPAGWRLQVFAKLRRGDRISAAGAEQKTGPDVLGPYPCGPGVGFVHAFDGVHPVDPVAARTEVVRRPCGGRRAASSGGGHDASVPWRSPIRNRVMPTTPYRSERGPSRGSGCGTPPCRAVRRLAHRTGSVSDGARSCCRHRSRARTGSVGAVADLPVRRPGPGVAGGAWPEAPARW